MLGYKVMPSLLPLDSFCDENMSTEEEMDVVPGTAKTPCPMDLTIRMPNSDKNTCYRTSSTDSLITNGSIDDNEGDGSDAEFQYQGYRPRLPTADMILMLNKHKRLPKFKVPACDTSFPLNLCTKDDSKQSVEEKSPVEKDEFVCSNDVNCKCNVCVERNHQIEDNFSDQNRFDWSEYRRSMSCSQIDFRFHRRLLANRLQRKLSINDQSSASTSNGEKSSEMPHDRDDGFHDEVDMNSGKNVSDIRNSPVKRLIDSRASNGSVRRRLDDGATSKQQDTSCLLMNEPPEAFVHTLEQLSFGNQIQKSQPSAFLQSLTDQYVPQYVKPLNAFPVDAYGYYAHLMQRLQTHHVLESSSSHHSTPNLSMSPTQADESVSSDGNFYGGIHGKKRPPRALTGRHVREGTGASPSTLVSLRKAIEERQRMKKTDIIDRKVMSKKKSSKCSTTRPRAYSASLSVRTVAEDVESDTISVSSE